MKVPMVPVGEWVILDLDQRIPVAGWERDAWGDWWPLVVEHQDRLRQYHSGTQPRLEKVQGGHVVGSKADA